MASDARVRLECVRSQFVFATKTTELVEETMERALEDALEYLCDTAIDVFGHGGYENNDGGEGVMRLDANGKLSLEHSDFYTERDTTSHEIDPTAPPTPPEVQAEAPAASA